MADRIDSCPTCNSLAFFHDAEGEGGTSYIMPIYTSEKAREVDILLEMFDFLAGKCSSLARSAGTGEGETFSEGKERFLTGAREGASR